MEKILNTIPSISQEIDEDLLSCLAGLIKTEQLKAAGPASRLKEEFIGGDGDGANGSRNGNDDGSEEMEEEKYISKAAKATLKVLRMVQRLLKAEMKTEKKTEVRLLTALLNEANPEVSTTSFPLFHTFLRDTFITMNYHLIYTAAVCDYQNQAVENRGHARVRGFPVGGDRLPRGATESRPAEPRCL